MPEGIRGSRDACGNMARDAEAWNAHQVIVMNTRLRRFVKYLVVGLAGFVGLFALLQIIPYGRTHSSPPTISEPVWDSPRTRELAERACFDCHSNETKWPWYANVA